MSVITNLIKDISDLSNNFTVLVTKQNSINSIWQEHLQHGKNILEWGLKAYNISFKGQPADVKKKYIFYCELGFNIGSEQNGKRPVVVIQNDKGNINSTITMVASISTHNGMKIIGTDSNGEVEVEYLDKSGNKAQKKLKYYEIPVKVNPGYKQEIVGYINLTQIRTISKKRLDKSHVAVLTDDAYSNVDAGLKKMFELNN